MSAKANHFKLGLFIILGTGLGCVAVVVLGVGTLFEKKITLETYLDQSVQGVDVGSKVKYRGVPIGYIRKIDFTRFRYQLDKPQSERRSYVRLEIMLSPSAFAGKNEADLREDLRWEVANGLRARITSLGLTGTSYVEVDYLDPLKYPPLPIDWVPDHPYVPSAPSTLSRIFNSAEDVFSQLEQIDFKGIARRVEQMIIKVDGKVHDLQLAEISTNTVGLLTEIRDTNRQFQEVLSGPELESVLGNTSAAAVGLRAIAESPELTNTVAQARITLRHLDRMLSSKDYDLQVTVDNLRALTDNLRELTESAKRFPAQLLFGEPPPSSFAN
jgi:ABC-type transporter Mla subunit MlaD